VVHIWDFGFGGWNLVEKHNKTELGGVGLRVLVPSWLKKPLTFLLNIVYLKP
jgi:hypothetical protein